MAPSLCPPELIVVKEGVEFAAEPDLRVGSEFLTQNRLRRSRHVNRRPNPHSSSPRPLDLRLRLRQLELRANDAARVHLRRLVHVADVAPSSQSHIAVHHLAITHPQQSNAEIESIEGVVGGEGADRLAEVVLVAAAHAHVDVLVAQEIEVALDYASQEEISSHLPRTCSLKCPDCSREPDRSGYRASAEEGREAHTTSSVQLSLSLYMERPTMQLQRALSSCFRIFA